MEILAIISGIVLVIVILFAVSLCKKEDYSIRTSLIERAKCNLCFQKVKALKKDYVIDWDKFFCEKCRE